MKFLISILSCIAVMLSLSFSFGQHQRGNTFAPVPIQVMGEGRLTNLAAGTGLKFMLGTTNTLSNSFTGYWQTNCTWILYTNGGPTAGTTGAPIVGVTVPLEGQSGTFQPTVSQPGDDNARNWLIPCARGSNDICPQATFKAGLLPSVLVVGCTVTVSNWTPEGSLSTFKGFDLYRIGQSPYVICQFQDNVDAPNKINFLVHTPDSPGVGASVIIADNGEIYHTVLLYDAPNDRAGLKVFQKLSNGRWMYKGESKLPLTTSTAAENIFFGLSDDHSPWGLSTSVGGDFRLSHFWMTTNREAYLNNDFPKY